MAARADDDADTKPRITARTNQEAVRVKSEFFSEVGLWPRDAVDAVGWLENFEDEVDVAFAAHLLNGMLFYSDALVRELIRGSVEACAEQLAQRTSWAEVLTGWDSFMAEAAWITASALGTSDPNTSPLPDIADSVFSSLGTTRLSRDTLEVASDAAALFVIDDYLGGYSPTDGRADGLRGVVERVKGPAFLCVAIAQESAVTSIDRVEGLYLSSPHVLPAKYSVTSEDSVVWPDHLLNGARSFLLRASQSAGVDAAWVVDGSPAVALAFSYRATAHTVPLLLDCPSSTWKPLLRNVAL